MKKKAESAYVDGLGSVCFAAYFLRGREDIVNFWEFFPGFPGFSRGVIIKTSTTNPDVVLGVRPRLYSSCFKKLLERK